MARDRLWVVVYVYRGVEVFLFPYRSLEEAQTKLDRIAGVSLCNGIPCAPGEDHQYSEASDTLTLEELKIPGQIDR